MIQFLDGKFREQHPQQYTASVVHQPVGEYFTPPTQLERVGHNIACASYPFSDSYYGGVVPACGPQALVHSHCVGVHQARMALPLEMAEEPVYVNAKQYHGILRRRQIRAKAELEKKLIKVRKPYLHESRHLHAMRRARGCGGRFLNTKKGDAHASNASHDNGTNPTVTVSTHPSNSTSSGSILPQNTRSGDSSIGQMQPQHTYSDSNGNGYYPQHQGFQLFRFNPLSDDSVKRGDFSGKKSERIVVNGARNRALTIK
ncbi:nuclear transcription factor Y subunit A-7-like [Pistacia vera]|uniref:nuclear transcription factor Y subunit A-7-like n=1 Tax=Pistacia vera TaxID=55513 RepID=UPI001262C03F|nr:nuclear transcription factor Y subunit A-7-like [Pistacia vera]